MTEGGRTKATPDKTQNLPDKIPRKKLPEQKLRELRQAPCKDMYMYACNTKNRGV